ncbi:MAG TPA: transcription antitermination factor NusB [Termitinemataceae bacterium]|nr:transcription antitermination factor NusB [Termitinemataceae bacterium]HOM23101.1 transcription antitermination factor NusB [Termitinemataceae bacterium]HPP99951.1 transcription antitermination factor NusB [Termitinemataceae bacterium]
MASRHKARILAFQALYSWDVSRVPVEDLLDFPWLEEEQQHKLDEGVATFAHLLIQGTLENIEAIDATIKAHLKNWDFSRVNKVDLAILRISTYALMFQKDMAPSIIIDEAIDLSREFGTDESYRFVNGVLDSIRRSLQR